MVLQKKKNSNPL